MRERQYYLSVSLTFPEHLIAALEKMCGIDSLCGTTLARDMLFDGQLVGTKRFCARSGIGCSRMTGYREFALYWGGGLRQPDRMFAKLSDVGRRCLLR